MDSAEYYKLRLQHTIEHLNQATRLIYFVSGAAVAMLYFVVGKDSTVEEPVRRYLGIGLILLIFALFLMHGLFIWRQDRHYKDFDALFAASVGVGPKERRYRVGTGRLYAGVHWVVAIFALVAAVYFLVSGKGL